MTDGYSGLQLVFVTHITKVLGYLGRISPASEQRGCRVSKQDHKTQPRIHPWGLARKGLHLNVQSISPITVPIAGPYRRGPDVSLIWPSRPAILLRLHHLFGFQDAAKRSSESVSTGLRHASVPGDGA
ncbi:unnamed protein product [Boreogadus saida]